MKIKPIYLFFILFFLQNCGYDPIYTKFDNQEYKFNIIEISGDSEMNNIFTSQIKNFSNNQSEKTLNIKVKNYYQKDILTKNKEGEATSYLIKTKLELLVIDKNGNQPLTFQEDTKTLSMSNNFEFKKYERTIKNNFINSKIEEFILKISTLR